MDGQMKRKQELRHDAPILAKEVTPRTWTVREDAQDVQSRYIHIIRFQHLFMVPSRAAHSHPLTGVLTPSR